MFIVPVDKTITVLMPTSVTTDKGKWELGSHF